MHVLIVLDSWKKNNLLIEINVFIYLKTCYLNHLFQFLIYNLLFSSKLCCCTITDICMSVSWDWHFINTIDGHQSKQVSHCTFFQARLFFRSVWLLQANNFWLWALGDWKKLFSCRRKCWAPRISWLGSFKLLQIFLRPHPCFQGNLF